MSNGNVQVSLTNLTQMDRYQTDTHRGPMVNQDQNAEAARQEAARRIMAPPQPDKAEGKKIDPEAKREEESRKKRKRHPQGRADGPENQAQQRNDRGRIIDYKA